MVVLRRAPEFFVLRVDNVGHSLPRTADWEKFLLKIWRYGANRNGWHSDRESRKAVALATAKERGRTHAHRAAPNCGRLAKRATRTNETESLR